MLFKEKSTKFLSSSRLFFRPWELSDLGLATTLWGDPEVTRFIDVRGKLTEEQVLGKLQAEINCLKEHRIQYWPLFEKTSEDFVGCCGLKPWVHSSRSGPELGFHIIKLKWGNGFAKEAAQEVIKYAFNDLGIERIMAGHHPQNENSKKILKKIGFNFVEDVFFKPTGLYHLSYELLRPR